jgi:glycosyltransferase involved in cell wall biosynthesis
LKRKRVLLMDLGRVKGGVETYLERLAAVLREDVDFYCICILPELAQELRAQDVRVILLPKFGAWGKPLGFLITIFLLPLIVLRNRIDAVQVNGFLEAVFLPMMRLLGKEAVYTRHGPFEVDLYKWYRNPRRFLPRFLSKFCVRFATRVICVSEDTRTTVRGIVPIERTVVIQNWVSYLPPYRSPAATLQSPVRLLCVARLEQYKGIQLVIEALRTLPGAALTVVGDGNYRTQLEELSAGMNVRFAGYQPNPSPFYGEADIFIMPSLGPEGSSLGAIEAMAYSLPCVLSDLPVYEELTASGKAAIHFHSGDVVDLTDKLALLINEHALRASYCREGYAMVKQHYTAEVARRLYLQAFCITPIAVEANA